MGKLTISMAIFHSYVSLPEGRTCVHATNSLKAVNRRNPRACCGDVEFQAVFFWATLFITGWLVVQ